MVAGILLVHGNAERYGSDRAALSLARGLHALGLDVTVALPEPCALEDALVAAGVRTVHLDVAPFRPRVFTIGAFIRYALFDLPRGVVRSQRAARRWDLVHLNTSILLGGLIGAALARRPVVMHVRESHAGYERSWRLYGRVIRWCATRVIATSTAIEAECRAAGIARTTTIHDGVDFAPPRHDPSPAGTVLAVGRINDWKGHDVLIEAIARLHQRNVPLELEIAGDAYPGQEQRVDDLRELAARRGVGDHVRLLGWVDDVSSLHERAAIFVQPSVRPEPFGLALVDAMASGVASIATDAGGPQDIIQHGRTGLLVPMGDVDALADALEALAKDDGLRERLGAQGAEDVRRRFSEEASASQVAREYERLLISRR